MKKSSLKTFLAGKNPFDGVSCLNGADQLGSERNLEHPSEASGEYNQWIKGFDDAWYCDVLGDGTAITYYPA